MFEDASPPAENVKHDEVCTVQRLQGENRINIDIGSRNRSVPVPAIFRSGVL